MNSCWLNHYTKCRVKINVGLLIESLGNKSSFVSVHKPIELTLNLEQPLTRNNVFIMSTGHQLPCLVFQQSIKPSFHGCSPLRVLIGLFKGSWDKRFNMGQIVQDFLRCVNIISRQSNNTSGRGTSGGVQLRTSCGRMIRWIGCKRQVKFCSDTRWWQVKELTKEARLG